VSATATREAAHIRTSGRTEYLTPRFVLDALGPFDLDPCASVVRPWPMAAKHYTIEDNGLEQPWQGLVWLNPPFGRGADGTCEADWIRKLSQHGAGGIALTSPAKTETKMFQDIILPRCAGILLLTPRLKFCNVDGSEMGGTFGASCLVAFGCIAWERLMAAVRNGPKRGGLGGHLVVRAVPDPPSAFSGEGVAD
jgi:hypothetical protein